MILSSLRRFIYIFASISALAIALTTYFFSYMLPVVFFAIFGSIFIAISLYLIIKLTEANNEIYILKDICERQTKELRRWKVNVGRLTYQHFGETYRVETREHFRIAIQQIADKCGLKWPMIEDEKPKEKPKPV